jgi:hypothetical protein
LLASFRRAPLVVDLYTRKIAASKGAGSDATGAELFGLESSCCLHIHVGKIKNPPRVAHTRGDSDAASLMDHIRRLVAESLVLNTKWSRDYLGGSLKTQAIRDMFEALV